MLKLDRMRVRLSAAVATSLLAALWAGAATVDVPRMGQLVVGQNADGRLELFQVDRDGELRHRSQKASHSDWSAWSSLGGVIEAGLAVANNPDGTLEVFAVDAGSQALRCIRQVAPNSLDWGNWIDVGGGVRAPVTVGQNLDGRLEVFAVDAINQKLKLSWQTDLQDGWSGWMELSGPVQPGLAAGRNRDGRLELFGVDASNNLVVHCWQLTANGVNSWSNWRSLEGPRVLPGLAVGQNADGGLALFAVSMAGTVDYTYQVFTHPVAEWSPWCSLAGNVQAGISVGQNGDGRLEVFAVDREAGELKHRSQDYPFQPTGPTNWSSWGNLGAGVQPAAAVARSRDGTLEIFVVNATNAAVLIHRQILGNRDWLSASDMEHSTIQYISRTWQNGEGLPHNDVQAIAQTGDGYLWVGTRDGLARFDGVQFTRFDPRNTRALASAFVTSLCVDHDGVLWVGTRDGLVRLKNGVFSRLDKRQGLAGDAVRALYESEDRALWVGTGSGLSRYQNGKFSNYPRQEALTSDVVNSIGGSRDGHIWIATEAGLVRWTETRVDRYTEADGLPNNVVRCICRDRAGRVWAGSDNGMIACTRGNAYRFYAYNAQHGLSDNFVSAIYADRQGNLWAGTYSGLNRLREGRLFGELTSEGLPYDKVNAIFEDRENNLWIGSRDGLTRLTPRKFFPYTKRQGLTHNNITSVREDRAGNLWIGTWHGGLNQLKDDRVRAYTRTNGLPHDLVLATCEGRDGSLWVGADLNGGLTRLLNGTIAHYDQKDGLINAAVRVIHEDQTGNLWVGTSRGLSCFRDGKFKNYTVKDGLAGDEVRAICENHAGQLWLGTDAGLSRWEKGHFANFTIADGLSDNSVMALYEDRQQNLWIGTAAGGLNRMSLLESLESNVQSRKPARGIPLHEPRITSYTSRQGLFSDEIFEILEDDYGWLWMSCSRGVFRVHKTDFLALDQKKRKALTSFAYGRSDGLESTLCTAVAKPAGWKSRDGRLWFPTTKGLIAIVPDIQMQHTPPPVFIEQVLADKKPVSETVEHSLTNFVTIPAGRGELEFRYTALNFQAPEKSLFKYRLEGVNSDWIEAGTRRVAYYNSINPGRYCFRVMGCNSDGVWNETGAALAILVLPHPWQTWWFRGLAILAVLGSVGALARYGTHKRLQRRLASLEQQNVIEKERGRIAKDIHDDLGSSLTFITMLGERAREDLNRPKELAMHTDKIVGYARGAVQSLDEIVWAVDPQNDTLDGLVGYLNQFASQFFENTNLRCRLEIPETLPSLVLPAEVRHALFLAVKEALNNVLKHAQASEVCVSVTETAAVLEIDVEDNGRGFDAGQVDIRGGGNGLENMRKRMAKIGGDCRLTCVPGQGTKLTFKVKVDASYNRTN